MGNCMMKRESDSKADIQGVRMGGAERRVRYLDYSQPENNPIFDQSLESIAFLKVLGSS